MTRYHRREHLPPLSSESGRFSLGLLGGFELKRDGHTLPILTGGSQRLLAFLGLRERSVTRTAAADMLWPDASEAHAHSSLRSAISRLPPAVQESLDVGPRDLRLRQQVDVDVRRARALAHRLLAPDAEVNPKDLTSDAITILSADLLPDWYDDWAITEAEGWHQLRLHALEAAAIHLLTGGRYSQAADAALLAIQAEPLRESAHAAIIRIHIAEGNQSEAMAAYAQYRARLQEELQLEPTSLLSDLVKCLR